MMMGWHGEIEIRGEQQQPDVELDLDHMAEQEIFLSLKAFYDQMDFSADRRLAITKAIIELIDSSGGSHLVENMRHGEEDSRTTPCYSTRKRQILPSYYNKPFYVTA